MYHNVALIYYGRFLYGEGSFVRKNEDCGKPQSREPIRPKQLIINANCGK